jgi:hypothetical protein
LEGVDLGLQPDAFRLGLGIRGGQRVDLLGDDVLVLVGEQHRVFTFAELHQRLLGLLHLHAQGVEARLDHLVDVVGAFEAGLDVCGHVLLDVDVEPLGDGVLLAADEGDLNHEGVRNGLRIDAAEERTRSVTIDKGGVAVEAKAGHNPLGKLAGLQDLDLVGDDAVHLPPAHGEVELVVGELRRRLQSDLGTHPVQLGAGQCPRRRQDDGCEEHSEHQPLPAPDETGVLHDVDLRLGLLQPGRPVGIPRGRRFGTAGGG